MIQAKGYAAQDQHTHLAPWNFKRREVGPHDVQINILYCGVCHSDLHQIRDDWGGAIFPMVPGHEIVGDVVNVGSHVKKFKTDDRVAVGNLVDSCRQCENCTQGLEQYCTDGFSLTYNSREQNGVVLVTTKKGRAGTKAKWKKNSVEYKGTKSVLADIPDEYWRRYGLERAATSR